MKGFWNGDCCVLGTTFCSESAKTRRTIEILDESENEKIVLPSTRSNSRFTKGDPTPIHGNQWRHYKCNPKWTFHQNAIQSRDRQTFFFLYRRKNKHDNLF